MAEVRNKKEKIGFIDRKGSLVIDYQFQSTQGFYEGLAAVKKKEKWGFINTRGIEVIPFRYDNVVAFPDDPMASGFSGGKAKVKLDGFEFFIDKKGNCVLGCLN